VGANDKERIQCNVSGIMKVGHKVQSIIDKLNAEVAEAYDRHKQPFVVGEKVVAVDAIPDKRGNYNIKNGKLYKIYSCKKQMNNGEMYWYVGVEGNGHKTHDMIRPSIFRSLTEAEKQPFVLKLLYGDQT
jgi:hypothetical protein